MPQNIPSLKPKELIRILDKEGCGFYREGKGDHRLYVRQFEDKKIVPIDVGLTWFSPPYVLRIFRQFSFTDEEIEKLLKDK